MLQSCRSCPVAAASGGGLLQPLYVRLARPASARPRRCVAYADKQSSSTTPTEQAAPDQPAGEELPVWVRSERERELQAQSTSFDLPWPLYLLFSGLVAIAAVGSVFEFGYKNAIFGVVSPDSPLWAPILGLFAFTGLPLAGFLFFRGVSAFNEEAEKQDRIDGYMD